MKILYGWIQMSRLQPETCHWGTERSSAFREDVYIIVLSIQRGKLHHYRRSVPEKYQVAAPKQ